MGIAARSVGRGGCGALAAGTARPDYRPFFARRLRLTDSVRFRFAVARFTFERFETLRFDRFPSLAGMCCSSLKERGSLLATRYSSQSFSRSFFGRYSSVMKEIPRRESASSSYFTPDFTISWISCCHCFAWNQG
jgi:hypothetical protein